MLGRVRGPLGSLLLLVLVCAQLALSPRPIHEIETTQQAAYAASSAQSATLPTPVTTRWVSQQAASPTARAVSTPTRAARTAESAPVRPAASSSTPRATTWPPQWWENCAEAVRSMPYNPKPDGWIIRCERGRAGRTGFANFGSKTIELYVRNSDTIADIQETYAHELGHVLDQLFLTAAERNEWRELRGIAYSWWPSCGCDDRWFGSGDFAEAFVSLWVSGSRNRGRYGAVTSEQLQWLRLHAFD